MPKLTDRAVKTTKPTDKDQFLADGAGLYLRVTPAGSRIWLYRYANKAGKTRWHDLGTYPTLSLAEARAEALRLKAQRRSGIDPVEERQRLEAERKASEAAQAARLTVNQMFTQWHQREITKHRDGGEAMKRMFEHDVLPYIGDMHAEDVRKTHVMQIVDRVVDRGGNGRMAVVVLAGVRQMFGYGLERDLVQADPTASIKKSKIHTPTERARYLTQAEIRLLAEKLPHAGLAQQSQLAILAILATACRVGELSDAELAHIDLTERTWRIPGDVAKNGGEHIISLSAFALPIFQELKGRAERLGSRWLMPATNKPDAPVCPKSLTKQITDRQRPGEAPMKGRSPHVDALVLPGGEWHSHDLRRTAATLMGELRVHSDVIEKVLNHREQNRMKRVYQRHTSREEMAEAWQLLGDRLALLTAPETNVVTLQPRAA